MKLTHQIKTAFGGLRTNKSRSALTILGIVIGIAAIMLIMSVGAGAQEMILGQMSGMGSETVVVRPGRQSKDPSSMAMTLFNDSLKIRDLEAIEKRSNVPGLKDAFATVLVSDAVSFEGTMYRPTIFGSVATKISDMFQIELASGAFFDDEDVKQYAHVAVIGSKVKTELFGDQEAVGKYITIKDQRFRVSGVMKKRGQASFFNADDSVMLPWTTAQKYLLGVDHFHEIIARAESATAVDEMVRDITATIRETHGITDPSKDDFNIVTQEGLVAQVNTIMSILTSFLTAVVAISLVVGGIGVMNIMLVSVTERTKEIGLRKALGATEKDIMVQFLLEAVMLTGVGGFIGIVVGLSFSFLASVILSYALQMNWAFSIPFMGALLGLVTSGLVGLAFGIYPAKQAAHKDPIEALRYE